MNYAEESLRLHGEWRGKIAYSPKMSVKTRDDLSLAYTPGVAQPCLEIARNPDLSYRYTGRGNLVAVITDGTAVLGLGDIGPEAAMPVMEGKCVLFKAFGNVDAIPLCLRTKDVDGFVDAVALLAGSFGGINLEDISAPRCFEIERKLKERCDIPVFHDDQHGTAVVVLAALMGALELTGRAPESTRVVISGTGAAGIAIARLLISVGTRNIVMCDRRGIVSRYRSDLNEAKREIADVTNKQGVTGTIADALRGADVFVGVSAPGAVTREMIRSMAAKPVIFPMANPTPEIMPDDAFAAGAAIVGTGRSDFPNQINNVLAFPGIFRGALDVRASDINDGMKIAAAYALRDLARKTLSPERILPEAFDPRVGAAVAAAVSQAARASGVARI
ncbi:MAG: NAD-dependent malic enzyme [Oscillospiraceae bacterium]|jgi:malate dehydrogenase (oxaloacetate-decarboxylating)|nr:NAD-dependent malic enzyme [Oscillospiraceae bacterium]